MRSREFQALGSGPAGPAAAAPAASLHVESVGDLLREVERRSGQSGWRIFVFHLSRLQKAHRREKHLQVAANMLENVVARHAGHIFRMPNHDLAIVGKGLHARTIEDAVETLRYLFNDDPLAEKSPAESGFCSSFDLEKDHSRFLAAFRRHRADASIARPAPTPPDVAQAGSSLDPARVAELLNTVAKIDLSPMLRRQTVWRVIENEESRPHSDEVFISIKALRQAVGSAFDVVTGHQLFGYLTRWLDQHMLKTLSWEHFSAAAPLSFNINLETLRSPEFADFDRRRPPGQRDCLMLELQLADVWGDFPGFLELNRRLRQDGYLLCLDGVVFSALRFLNLHRLGVDYIKLAWDDGLPKLGESELRELFQSIAECGRERIILTRCGREDTIRVGRALGIQLFQGWTLNGTFPHPSPA